MDRIHHAGFSYGYVEIVDMASVKHFCQVGGGVIPMVVVEMPTLEEAVKESRCLFVSN